MTNTASALTLCTVTILAPARVRGGKGFEARYQARLAIEQAYAATYCADKSQQPRATALDCAGLAGCNDCADGMHGIAHHFRGPAGRAPFQLAHTLCG